MFRAVAVGTAYRRTLSFVCDATLCSMCAVSSVPVRSYVYLGRQLHTLSPAFVGTSTRRPTASGLQRSSVVTAADRAVVSLSLSLSLYSHISETTSPTFAKFPSVAAARRPLYM